MLFGATSTPFILNAGLRYYLQQYQTPVADDITQNLYVDNTISGKKLPHSITNRPEKL